MWISDFAIRRPVITLVTMLAIVVFGLFSYFSLDTDEYPEVNPPVVSVAVPYPGASPDVVEREVIDPMEEAISSISGVDEVTSSSLDGFGLLIVSFDFDKEVQQATQDIRDALSQIRGDLPQEMEEPILTRFDPNDLPIISLTLSSTTLSAAELTRLADPGITRQLRGVSGVAQVDVVGGVERELVVEIKPLALQAAGVSIAQVVQALQTQNLAVPVGSIRGDLVEHTIRLRGRLQGPADFQQIVVSQSGGRLVRLGDVADVRDGAEEARTLALYNNEEAVGIDITKTTSSSTTAVSEAVLKRVEDIQAGIPEGATLRVVRDAGERVETSVANVREALLEGALLTVLVVFLFLNTWRSTVITGIALPISVLASFMAVWAFGFTLNTMSLLGLSLAIGILIDDAIVVRENIVRHVEMGKDHYTAAREGTAEIGLAVAATTFSIVVVFVPIGFMDGIAGQWFKPFALTIASSVLVSLFVSFSLDPMLSAYWPDPHKSDAQKAWITRKLDRFNAWFDRQAEGYKRVIGWALDHRWKMMALAAGSFFLALAMPALGIVGSSFFPVQDISEFNVIIEAPPGSSMDYTRLKIEEVVRIARSYDEVAYTYASIGGQSGSVDEGTVYVRLVPRSQRDRLQSAVERDMRDKLASIGGATASISAGGFGGEKQIDIQLRGPDSRVLNDLASRIETEVRQVPGAVDVGLSTKGQRPELDVQVERGLAATLGLSVAQVANSLRTAFAGIDAGDWVDPTGETRDVTVRLDPQARARARDLNSLPLTVVGPTGPATVPLGQVARVSQTVSPAQIDHLDGERVISVQANTQGRPLSEVIGEITTRLDNVDIPAGYSVSQGGETESQQEVFTSILAALGIAVMLMYLVLVVQFGSFLDPFAIMLSLPLSLIGVMLALLVTGSTVNLMSLIGVILLMGIVAKNAILLIDFAKWSEEEGMERREAIIEAGRVRLRPILMTTFALVAGMLPVAIGSGEGGDFRAPLGRAVIGGVLTSTLLTLLVIPTAYEILADWRDALFARLRGGKRAAAPVHEEVRAHTGAGAVRPVAEAGD
jgi:hydrophobic/amphiphilic exporter-1 (mainly G- bacteria), HAE1 family